MEQNTLAVDVWSEFMSKGENAGFDENANEKDPVSGLGLFITTIVLALCGLATLFISDEHSKQFIPVMHSTQLCQAYGSFFGVAEKDYAVFCAR